MIDPLERRPWLVPLILALLCVIFFRHVLLPQPGFGAVLLLVLHVWWGAWGMDRLARSFGASALGGLLAGVTFGFSSLLIANIWAGHYTRVLVMAWGPWVLAAYRHALARGTWRAALPGAAALGLALLAGDLPTAAYAALLLVALWGYHVVQDRPALRLATRQLAIIILGGVLLAAVQWLPTFASVSGVPRTSDAGPALAGDFAPPGLQLLTLLLPNLLGNPDLADWGYWGGPNYEEWSAFAGVWALFAALLAGRLKRREAVFYWGVGLLGLILSGGLLVLRQRAPGGGLYLVVIALAGLSALVVTHLGSASLEERRDLLRPALRVWMPAAAVLVFGAVLVLLALWSLAPPASLHWRWWHSANAAAETGLIILAVGLTFWLWREDGPRAVEWAALATVAVVLIDLWRIGLPLVTLDTIERVHPVSLWSQTWLLGVGISSVSWLGLLALSIWQRQFRPE